MTDLHISAEVQSLIADIAAPLTDAEIQAEVAAMDVLFAKLQPRTLRNPQPAINAAMAKILEAGGSLILSGKTWVYKKDEVSEEVRMNASAFAEFRKDSAMTKKSDAIRRADLGVPANLITYANWGEGGWWFEISEKRLRNEHLYLLLEDEVGTVHCLKVPSSRVANLYRRVVDDKPRFCGKLDGGFVDRMQANGQDLSGYHFKGA